MSATYTEPKRKYARNRRVKRLGTNAPERRSAAPGTGEAVRESARHHEREIVRGHEVKVYVVNGVPRLTERIAVFHGHEDDDRHPRAMIQGYSDRV